MSEAPDSARDDDLQFDTAVPIAPNAQEGDSTAVTCASCRATLRETYYTVGTDPVCARCRDLIAQQAAPVREWPVLARATVLGLGAAILGAILYYAVIAITGWEIGLVAILCGYMVGWAVRKGAAGRGGRRLQVAAVVLTYLSVAFAYLPLAIRSSSDSAEAAPQVIADSALASSGGADRTGIGDIAILDSALAPASPGVGVSFGALGALLYLTLSLPVLVILGSMPSGLISALIIGFGMRQAWTMTGAPELAFHGPFAVGRGGGSATQRPTAP